MELPYHRRPPDHVSVSQVRMILKCAFQWYLRYLWGMKGKSHARKPFGTAAHAGIATANQLWLYGSPMDNEIITGAAVTEFYKQLEYTDVTAWGDFINQEAAKQKLASLLAAAVPAIQRIVGQPLYIEHPIADERLGGNLIVFENGLPLTGYVDLFDVNGSIWDFKVGKPKSQRDADWDLQLGIYAFAFHGLPREPVKTSLVSVDPKTRKVTAYESSRDARACERAYYVMNAGAKAITAAIENHSFPPNTEGWWCGADYCDFHDRCPFGGGSWADILEPPAMATQAAVAAETVAGEDVGE